MDCGASGRFYHVRKRLATKTGLRARCLLAHSMFYHVRKRLATKTVSPLPLRSLDVRRLATKTMVRVARPRFITSGNGWQPKPAAPSATDRRFYHVRKRRNQNSGGIAPCSLGFITSGNGWQPKRRSALPHRAVPGFYHVRKRLATKTGLRGRQPASGVATKTWEQDELTVPFLSRQETAGNQNSREVCVAAAAVLSRQETAGNQNTSAPPCPLMVLSRQETAGNQNSESGPARYIERRCFITSGNGWQPKRPGLLSRASTCAPVLSRQETAGNQNLGAGRARLVLVVLSRQETAGNQNSRATASRSAWMRFYHVRKRLATKTWRCEVVWRLARFITSGNGWQPKLQAWRGHCCEGWFYHVRKRLATKTRCRSFYHVKRRNHAPARLASERAFYHVRKRLATKTRSRLAPRWIQRFITSGNGWQPKRWHAKGSGDLAEFYHVRKRLATKTAGRRGRGRAAVLSRQETAGNQN